MRCKLQDSSLRRSLNLVTYFAMPQGPRPVVPIASIMPIVHVVPIVPIELVAPIPARQWPHKHCLISIPHRTPHNHTPLSDHTFINGSIPSNFISNMALPKFNTHIDSKPMDAKRARAYFVQI